MNPSRPIIVIADDLSGAAELAGAAAAQGLSAEVQLKFTPDTGAAVIALDADTRSLEPEQARRIAESLARTVAGLAPAWIYKKCDSVLRGNVLAEIRGILAGARASAAVLIPANPSRGRIIRGGNYFVEGKPLADTAFARDPEHPRRSSVVADLLGGNLDGIQTPDAVSELDLDRIAEALPENTLPAGGVDFFRAILRRRTPGRRPLSPVLEQIRPGSLFVCGSAAAWEGGRQREFLDRELPVLPMPPALFQRRVESAALDEWVEVIIAAFRSGGMALVGIGNAARSQVAPLELAQRLGRAVHSVLRRQPVDRVFLEGGATASACVRALGFDRFHARTCPLLGVGILEAADAPSPLLYIKPGSYPWPFPLEP